MKNTFKLLARLSAIGALIALLINMNGCKPQETPSLYDPNWKSLPQPVVDSLSPAGSALAGIDTVTIYGKNFSAKVDSDGVYFNSTLVPIISASQNRITVKAPALSGDTIQVRVFVLGAVDFSPTVIYSLKAAINPFIKLASGEGAYGACMGPDSNLYVSLSNANLTGTKDEGVFKITPDGSSTLYASPTSGNVSWTALRFGPGSFLYAVKGVRAVYKLAQGGSGTVWAAVSSGAFSDLDFDASNNLWVVGNNRSIYRIKPDASIKTFPFVGNIRSVRYFNGYLYFAANVGASGDTSVVYRAPIQADSLGTPEIYFDIASAYPGGGYTIWAITFSANGDMYVGTDAPDYLIVVHPGAKVEKPYSLYVSSGVLSSAYRAFAWIGTNLYASTADGGLFKILARKQGAPYYGMQ